MQPPLKPGSTGQAVQRIQTALGITADGWFGPVTLEAVRQYQTHNHLVVDGTVGVKTWTRLIGQDSVSKYLTEADLQTAADALGCKLAAIKAVNAVESRGTGFLPNGKPVILFERHIFYKRLHEQNSERAEQLASDYPNICNPKRGGYVGGTAEWQRLTHAQQLLVPEHQPIAIEAASFGLFQIMGFHWQLLGYASAEAYASAMATSEGQQLDAFVRFIKSDRRLLKALRDCDWKTFASIYNGPAYADNAYDQKMAHQYAKFSATQSSTKAIVKPDKAEHAEADA